MARRVLQYLVLFALVLSIVSSVYVNLLIASYSFEKVSGEAAGSGTASFCINSPPTINNSCRVEINQSTSIEDNTYNCQIGFYDPDNHSFNFSYQPILQPGMNFTISPSGYMTIWANQSALGFYSTEILARDDFAPCPALTNESYSFQIVDINDPPFLTQNVPGRELSSGRTAVGRYYLIEYFDDWDDPYLNYTVSGNSNIQITIDQESTSVDIYVPEDFCESEIVYFTAIDKGNLTADSNMATLNSNCPSTLTPTSSGGGGSSSSCMEEWQCRSWSDCYPNGTRYRKCVDLNGCDPDNLEQVFEESCEYVPTCFDGIKNQGEEGVDCGGPCPSCFAEPTCSDGIRNQGETGVDCGGPCPACKEDPTCDDGIRNQGETGVDCGGPCPACKQVEVPNLIEIEDNSLTTAAIVVGATLTFLAFVWLLFRRELKKFFAKLNWWLTRNMHKQILLPKDKKEALLKELTKIETWVSDHKSKGEFKSSDKMVQKLLGLNREYFSVALGLNKVFDKEDLDKKSERVLFHDTLKKAFSLLMDKQVVLETKKAKLSRIHLTMLVEELRLLILSTSRTNMSDFGGIMRPVVIEGDSFKKLVRTSYNLIVSLQHEDVDSAKKNYFKIINYYEELDDSQKNMVYADVVKLYNYVTYYVSWSKHRG